MKYQNIFFTLLPVACYSSKEKNYTQEIRNHLLNKIVEIKDQYVELRQILQDLLSNQISKIATEIYKLKIESVKDLLNEIQKKTTGTIKYTQDSQYIEDVTLFN